VINQTTLVSHDGKVYWHLLRKHHPYLYGLRAFLNGEISAVEAASYIVADRNALDEFDDQLEELEALALSGLQVPNDPKDLGEWRALGPEAYLLLAAGCVEDVWSPAKQQLTGYNDQTSQAGQPRLSAFEISQEAMGLLMYGAEGYDDPDDYDDDDLEGSEEDA
jgi:hypothetical protein